METPFIIRVCSQKGGVGKTTIAVNLACALRMMGYGTLLVDADTTNPSVGFHLGMENANIGTWHFAHGKAKLKDTVHIHAPTGLHVMPGVVSAKAFLQTPEMVRRTGRQFKESPYQFIILDTQPGYLPNEAATHPDEALIVTVPSMPSCASMLRLASVFDKNAVKHGLTINRAHSKRYDLGVSEITESYSGKLIGVLPEDETVPISIAEHIPCVILNRRAKFSKAIMRLAQCYASGLEPESGAYRKGIMDWMRGLFGR
jgi:MinD-like ATPase involved in chromosome partitioning or flagellar assembly